MDWRKRRYMRDIKSFFKHLKGFLVEEGLQLFYVVLGTEQIHMRFWLNIIMSFLMNDTMISTDWPFTKPVSSHPEHIVRQHFLLSFVVRWVHVIKFWPMECDGCCFRSGPYISSLYDLPCSSSTGLITMILKALEARCQWWKKPVPWISAQSGVLLPVS